jgi:hypothetical protein
MNNDADPPTHEPKRRPVFTTAFIILVIGAQALWIALLVWFVIQTLI